MKYKLLQNAPNADKGDIFDIDTSSRFEFYTNGNASYHRDDVENNPDWFGKYILTTEDKVDIYNEKGTIAALVLKNYNENLIKKDDVLDIVIEPTLAYWNKDTWKFFSTRQAAEKYLEPKLKINDYFVYDNEVHKIDNIKISSFISNEKAYDKALCRKADNSEIISYYEKLGWIKGASFKEKGQTLVRTIELVEYDACTNILWIVGGQYPNKIEECELIKYPKSWEDLGLIKGYFVNNYSSVKKCNDMNATLGGKNIFNTSKQAESALAFSQLSQLVAEMNQNWQPNWENTEESKFIIYRNANKLITDLRFTSFYPLVFKSKEARDFSFQHHKDLWEKYWQI